MDTKASIKATIKSIKEEVVDEKSSFEKCHVCNETFDKFSLEVHNLACKKEIACQFCDKTFSKKGHLTYHVSAVHEVRKNVKCNKCEAGFENLVARFFFSKVAHKTKTRNIF